MAQLPVLGSLRPKIVPHLVSFFIIETFWVFICLTLATLPPEYFRPLWRLSFSRFIFLPQIISQL